MRKILLSLFCFLFLSTMAHATIWYGCSGGGNWNGATVWTSVIGDQTGCTGATGNPVAGDTATLNSTSGNITITATAAAAVLTMTGYTGTLALGTHILTLTGGFTGGGTITSGAGGSFTFAGTQTITPNITIPGNIIINTTGTYTLGSDLTSSGGIYNGGNITVTMAGAHNITTPILYWAASQGGSSQLTIVAGQSITVTSTLVLQGGSNQGFGAGITTIASTTTSAANLNFTGSTQNVDAVIFTHITNSNNTIYNYTGGTLTSTSGITNATSANLFNGTNVYGY